MADAAVEKSNRIGVIATLYTIFKPTSDLIRSRATIKGCEVTVETMLCEGAFEALGRMYIKTHDRIVKIDLCN